MAWPEVYCQCCRKNRRLVFRLRRMWLQPNLVCCNGKRY